MGRAADYFFFLAYKWAVRTCFPQSSKGYAVNACFYVAWPAAISLLICWFSLASIFNLPDYLKGQPFSVAVAASVYALLWFVYVKRARCEEVVRRFSVGTVIEKSNKQSFSFTMSEGLVFWGVVMLPFCALLGIVIVYL